MRQIVLVRHGQASWGAEDYDVLSELGERQGPVAGRALAAVRPDLLIHGSLRRQRETAAYVAEGAGWSLDARVDERWNELDHREVMGFVAAPESAHPTPEDYWGWFERAMTRWHSGDHDDEYPESWPSFRDRVLAALDELATGLDDDQTAVVVTSGGPISIAVSTLLEGGTPMYRSIINGVVNCSITRIRVSRRRGPRLASFNEQAHLTGEYLTYV